jgi:hypothetical protein
MLANRHHGMRPGIRADRRDPGSAASNPREGEKEHRDLGEGAGLPDLDSQFINTDKSVTLRSLINFQSVVSKLDMSASLVAIETH